MLSRESGNEPLPIWLIGLGILELMVVRIKPGIGGRSLSTSRICAGSVPWIPALERGVSGATAAFQARIPDSVERSAAISRECDRE